MNIVQSLGEYVNKVLDTNKDGVITFKDFIDLFPNSAIAIAVIFVDLVVGVAEYRVWDVGYQITDDPFKAFGFVLISAIPFYLGQIFWLYPVANFLQKSIAIGMITSSLYTSWIFGTADLTQNWDIPALVSTVTDMTAVYIVSVLIYIIFDDGIKAHRLKKQAQGKAAQEAQYQQITREILRELAKTQQLQRETEKEFGDAALVQAQVDRLRGTKEKKQSAPVYQQPMTANASDTGAALQLKEAHHDSNPPKAGNES